jgi:hypothetical protein
VKYKDFYMDLIVESPVYIEYGENDGLDIPSENKMWLDVAKKGNFLGKKVVGGVSYYTYVTRQKSDSYENVSYYFLNEQQTEIMANHGFKEFKEDGKLAIQNTLLWKSKKIKGFMKEWFKTDIVPTYDIIYSDRTMTNKGIEFWRWLFLTFVRRGMKMYAVNREAKSKIELKSPSELEKYRGNGKINTLFALYTKPAR